MEKAYFISHCISLVLSLGTFIASWVWWKKDTVRHYYEPPPRGVVTVFLGCLNMVSLAVFFRGSLPNFLKYLEQP